MSAIGAKGTVGALPPSEDHPGYVSGRYYPLARGFNMVQAALAVTGALYLYPFLLRRSIRINQLGLRVSTAGTGSTVKLGVWRSNPATLRPTGMPLVESAAIDTATTGGKSIDVTPTLIPEGLIWLGSKNTGTAPTCTCVAVTSSEVAGLAGSANIQNAVGLATGSMTGFSTPNPYADPMPDLTSAALTEFATGGIAVVGARIA